MLFLVGFAVVATISFAFYKLIQQWKENSLLRQENERLHSVGDTDKNLLEISTREIALLNGFLADAERDLGMMTKERDALAERLERIRPRSVSLDKKESETTATVVNING